MIGGFVLRWDCCLSEILGLEGLWVKDGNMYDRYLKKSVVVKTYYSQRKYSARGLALLVR